MSLDDLRRGDLVLVNLDPSVGSEANKTRPAVVVSNDWANRTSPVVIVVPINSNIAHVYSFQVFLPRDESGLDEDSKAQAEQIRTVDRRRLIRHLGLLSSARMQQVDAALRLHLGV